MTIFDAVTGDTVLFLCYGCDRYHQRIGTTTRHWREDHGPALVNRNQIIRFRRTDLITLGIAGIRNNPPPRPVYLINAAGHFINEEETILSQQYQHQRRFQQYQQQQQQQQQQPVPAPAPVMANQPAPVPAFAAAAINLPAPAPAPTNLPAPSSSASSSSSEEEQESDNNMSDTPTLPVLRGAPRGVAYTPMTVAAGLYHDSTIESWYQDPYGRPTGQGPTSDLLRRQNLEGELQDRGFSKKRATEGADFLTKLAAQRASKVAGVRRGGRRPAPAPARPASVPAPTASDEEDEDEDEDEEEDNEEDEEVVPALSLPLSAPVPFTASVEEAEELTADEIERRLTVLRGVKHRFDLVYGTGALEVLVDEEEGGEEVEEEEDEAVEEEEGKEKVWVVRLEDGREVVTGDVTFGFSSLGE